MTFNADQAVQAQVKKSLGGVTASDNGGIRRQVAFAWHELLSDSESHAKLIGILSQRFDVSKEEITAWSIIDGWDTREELFSNECLEKDSNLSPSLNGHSLEDLSQAMYCGPDIVDPRDLASDPLQSWWDGMPAELWRNVSGYFKTAGTLPFDFDTREIQAMFDRYPLTVEQSAKIYCVDERLWGLYLTAKGITPQKYASLNTRCLSNLILAHDDLARICAINATTLYKSRAVPIRRIARSLKINWADLWALGTRFSSWQLPVADDLRDIKSDVHNLYMNN